MKINKGNIQEVTEYMEREHPGVKLHNPYNHKYHEKKCGCQTNVYKELDEGKDIFMCRNCGAAYDLQEVFSFYKWKCYDCNIRYRI